MEDKNPLLSSLWCVGAVLFFILLTRTIGYLLFFPTHSAVGDYMHFSLFIFTQSNIADWQVGVFCYQHYHEHKTQTHWNGLLHISNNYIYITGIEVVWVPYTEISDSRLYHFRRLFVKLICVVNTWVNVTSVIFSNTIKLIFFLGYIDTLTSDYVKLIDLYIFYYIICILFIRLGVWNILY